MGRMGAMIRVVMSARPGERVGAVPGAGSPFVNMEPEHIGRAVLRPMGKAFHLRHQQHTVLQLIEKDHPVNIGIIRAPFYRGLRFRQAFHDRTNPVIPRFIIHSNHL